MTRRIVKVATLALLMYCALILMPAITCTLFSQGANNNGYSPYTMYERCHWQQFNIGPQSC